MLDILGGLLGGLFGGGGAPSYADSRQSPESTMTESQKAMQQYLTNLGKLGYEQGMQAFDPARIARGNAFYNATLAAIQNGTGRDPQSIKAAIAAQQNQQPQATTAGVEAPQFSPDEKLEEALKIYQYQNRPRGSSGSMSAQENPALENIMNGSNQTYVDMANNKITKETIEAYMRQKKAAEDAAAVAKFKGGK